LGQPMTQASAMACKGSVCHPIEERRRVTSNPDFKVTIYSTPLNSKMVQVKAIVTMADQ